MSSNSLQLSASAKWKFFGSAIPILASLGGLLFLRFHIKYKEPTKHYVQDLMLVVATAAFIPVLAALWVGYGVELPILIEDPSSTTTTKLAAVSDISSMITFIFCRLHFVVLFYEVTRGGTVLRWKTWAFGALVALLSTTVIILNILEWFLPRIDRHAIAIAHAIIRILITATVFGIILLTDRLWTLNVPLRKKVYVLSILICATGIFTTPFMAFRLHYYLAHKKEGLSAALLGYRIAEASLDIGFICLPYIVRPVLRRLEKRRQARTPSFSIKTPQTDSGCHEVENQKDYNGSMDELFRIERSEAEHEMGVLGSQSESLR